MAANAAAGLSELSSDPSSLSRDPLYRMHKAYFVKFDEINGQNISRQTAFGIEPENMASHVAYRQSRDTALDPAE